jgi:hypothetical protein
MEGLGMKLLTALVILLAWNNSFSDIIQKWTDESGQVHYGDNPPQVSPQQIEQLEIKDSFDPEAFDQANKRNSELYREIKLIEKREKSEAKIAEKELQKYFDQLDKKAREIERNKLKKRKSREQERNRTRIKLKRASTKKEKTKSVLKNR